MSRKYRTHSLEIGELQGLLNRPKHEVAALVESSETYSLPYYRTDRFQLSVRRAR
jgi:hypothetical protein